MDDSAFLNGNMRFFDPRPTVTLDRSILNFAQLIKSARSREVPKMIKIGLVGSAPHIREIYKVTGGVYLFFFILGNPTDRMGIAT
jgi:hypothetical protein